LAFVSERAGNAELFLLTLASGEIRRLTQDPAWDGEPAWLDGQTLLFSSLRSGEKAIWQLSLGDLQVKLRKELGSSVGPAVVWKGK
jgi:TolB protein